jgi:acetyl esterase/lipase
MLRHFVKPKMADGTLDDWRRRYESFAVRNRPPGGTLVESIHVGGLECEKLTPPGADRSLALLWFFGGGYQTGSPSTTRALAATIAGQIGAWALVPAYRLRPEHALSASLDDALIAYRWLAQDMGTADQIVVGGESAGGGLALRLLCAARDAGDPLPAAGVVISPWTDLAMSGGSWQTNAASEALFSSSFLERTRQNLSLTDPKDPRISPLYADLSGLPPLLIHVSGAEVALDDSLRFAERARAAGVDATLRVFPGLWHVFHNQSRIPEARKAVNEVAEFARNRLRTPVR